MPKPADPEDNYKLSRYSNKSDISWGLGWNLGIGGVCPLITCSISRTRDFRLDTFFKLGPTFPSAMIP